jgi:hypothetical protein
MMDSHNFKQSESSRASRRGFVRSHLLSLLAGIGVASIALFSTTTAFTVMNFIREMRKDGYTTTASATVTSSEIKIDTRMVPLPTAFWQERDFSVPAPELFEEKEPSSSPYVAVKTEANAHFHDPERTQAPANPITQPTPAPAPAPAPAPPPPKPSFDPENLRRAIHQNLVSVFTGDLPYLLLKSGDRLYPGSKLTEGVVLEAISPNGVLCSTPIGILKIEPEPNSPDQPLENENPDRPLPLDPPKPEADSQRPPSHPSTGLVM